MKENDPDKESQDCIAQFVYTNLQTFISTVKIVIKKY